MLDMHNPWSSLAITVKAVLIWDPRLDIRLRNAPFYSSQKLPLAPTSHSIWNGVAIFIVYLPRLKHFSPGCFDILEGGIILPIKIIGLARYSILQITLLPLFRTYHVHASSFCEVCSELCLVCTLNGPSTLYPCTLVCVKLGCGDWTHAVTQRL